MAGFCYNVFNCGNDVLLAIADREIIGRKFSGDGIEIFVSGDFYGGRECGRDGVMELVESSTIVNAVGKDIVKLMVSKGVVDSASVIVIGGVPHAQVVSGVNP